MHLHRLAYALRTALTTLVLSALGTSAAFADICTTGVSRINFYNETSTRITFYVYARAAPNDTHTIVLYHCMATATTLCSVSFQPGTYALRALREDGSIVKEAILEAAPCIHYTWDITPKKK